MRNKEEAAIDYADGVFRSYWYYRNKIDEQQEALIAIRAQMQGVRSPMIKSAEEAYYLNSIKPYEDKMPLLIDLKDTIEEQMLYAKAKVLEIETYIDSLSPENAKIMRLYYIEGKTLEAIAMRAYMSASTVWRTLRRCLLAFASD